MKKQQKNNRIPPGRNLFLEEEKKILSENSYEQDDWNKINNNYNLKPRRPSSVAVQTDPEEFALVISMLLLIVLYYNNGIINTVTFRLYIFESDGVR